MPLGHALEKRADLNNYFITRGNNRGFEMNEK